MDHDSNSARDSTLPGLPAILGDDPLARASLDVIVAGQAESGAIVASPTFSQYGFSWIRDGAFCALALGEVGHRDRETAFHRWVADAVLAHRDLFTETAADAIAGRRLRPDVCPPTRFHLDGSVEAGHDETWPNFQLDGYGTWLSLVDRAQQIDAALLDAVEVVADYLAATWRRPCYDCWEEFGDRHHGSTLMAIAGGLSVAGRLLDSPRLAAEAAAVRDELVASFTAEGSFTKGSADRRVDASLLWATLPHAAFAIDDPLVSGTVERVRHELQVDRGGVRRYLGDTYYGGGEWVLLTAWLGWNDAANDRRDGWERACAWIRATGDEALHLPEQTTSNAQSLGHVAEWTDRWGEPARPLLWSHAMYLLMLLEGRRRGW